MNTVDKPTCSLSITLGATFNEAIMQVKEAFKAEGFGVLMEMNVQQTLQEKIGFEMTPYTILGMCNPLLASRAKSRTEYRAFRVLQCTRSSTRRHCGSKCTRPTLDGSYDWH